MVAHLDDVVGAHTLEEDLHGTQLPVGNVCHILDVFQISQAAQIHIANLVPVGQGKGGNLLIAQLDNELLLCLVQTCGGFHISQLAVANLFFHVGHILFLAFIRGVLGTGGFIQGTPVGIGEDLLEDLLSFQGGLGSFKIAEPAVEPLQAQIGGTEKCQNKQEVNGVEDHTAHTGAFFLLFGLDRCFLGSGRLFGSGLFGSGGILPDRCALFGSSCFLGRSLRLLCGCGLFHRRGLFDGGSLLDLRHILQHGLVHIVQET